MAAFGGHQSTELTRTGLPDGTAYYWDFQTNTYYDQNGNEIPGPPGGSMQQPDVDPENPNAPGTGQTQNPQPPDAPPAQTPPPGSSTGSNKPNPGETIDAFLIRLLNGGMDREQAMAAAGKAFGFQAGQDGYPAHYPNNNTIGLKGGYLTFENGSWKYTTRGPEGGSGGFDGGVDPTYLQPFTDPVPGFEGDPGDFVRPTGDTIQEDPSYLFRRDQAVDVMTKGLAAQGLYHSGGTPHDITQLASNFAGTEYNNIFNRDAGIWESKWQHALAKNPQILQRYLTARDTFYANQNNPFAKLRDIASIGANTSAIAG